MAARHLLAQRIHPDPDDGRYAMGWLECLRKTNVTHFVFGGEFVPHRLPTEILSASLLESSPLPQPHDRSTLLPR